MKVAWNVGGSGARSLRLVRGVGDGVMQRALLQSVAALAVVAPAPAHAHSISVRFGSFYSGMLHPLTALEHLLAFLVLGVLFGLQERRRGALGVLCFAGALAVGAVIALALGAEPVLGSAATASLAVAGALVALALALSTAWVVVLAVVFGLVHGFENGTAFAPGSGGPLYVLGLAMSGYLVVTLLSAAVHGARSRRWALVGLRTLGSWVGALGLMMLGLAVAGA